jgi:hypothetical protein
MAKYKIARGNLLNLRHGLRSKIIRRPYELKYAARIRELADDDAEPQLVQWLAESLTTVDLGDQFIAKHGRGALEPWLERFYRRAVGRIPKLCNRLDVPLDDLRPRMQPKPSAKPEPVPGRGTREAIQQAVQSALRAAPAPTNPAPPRYLREEAVQRFGEMSWEERQEELRYPTIHDAGSTMPRYLREAMREGRL